MASPTDPGILPDIQQAGAVIARVGAGLQAAGASVLVTPKPTPAPATEYTTGEIAAGVGLVAGALVLLYLLYSALEIKKEKR